MKRSRGDFTRIDREIAALAVPALVTLLAEPLYVLTDTAIVGHLGTDHLAGLALASTVLVTGYAMFVFLAYGTTASVARLIGAGHKEQAAIDAVQSLWLAVILGVCVGTIGATAGQDLLRSLGGRGMVLHYAWIYLRISLLGVPALLVSLAGAGYLRGLQNTRVPLVVTISGAAVNLVVEVVLIYGFDQGIGASALASVIAQFGVAGCYLWFVWVDIGHNPASLLPRPAHIRRLFRVGTDLLIRTVVMRAALVVVTVVAAGMGAVVLAAHQIVFEVWNFVALTLDSIAIAAQAMIGRLLGQSDTQGATDVARRMMTWAIRLGVVAMVVVMLAHGVIPSLFSDDEQVIAIASTLLVIAALWQPINSIAFALDGILIGAGDTRFLAWSMTLAVAIFIPGLLWVGSRGLSIEWLWAMIGIWMILRASILGARLISGSWTRQTP